MVKPTVIAAKRFDEITKSAADSINKILGFQIQNISFHDGGNKTNAADIFAGIK